MKLQKKKEATEKLELGIVPSAVGLSPERFRHEERPSYSFG
jgi:hypothetical protein